MSNDDTTKQTIWERDLLDNPVGRIFGRFVFPLTAFAIGAAMASLVLSNFDIHRLADCTLLATSMMLLSYGCMWVFAKTIRPSTKAGAVWQERAIRAAITSSILFLGLTIGLRFADYVIDWAKSQP